MGFNVASASLGQGRPQKWHHEAEESSIDFLIEYSTVRLDEACDFLRDEDDLDNPPPLPMSLEEVAQTEEVDFIEVS